MLGTTPSSVLQLVGDLAQLPLGWGMSVCLQQMIALQKVFVTCQQCCRKHYLQSLGLFFTILYVFEEIS